jgi:uncharacterized protein
MLLLGGCLSAPVADPSALGFARGRVVISSARGPLALNVEIAESSRQLSTGLQGRSSLPDDSGMLFLFDREQDAGSGFWMFRTHIPLSIAFLDADGVIVGIRDMDPCTRRFAILCARYLPGAPYLMALEVNQGWFAENGVRVGDRVRVERLDEALGR